MRDECIKAVVSAAGRSLTQAEIKGIEERIARNQRMLATQDRPAYLAMSKDMRLREAGKMAAEELKHDAIKKKQRIAQTIRAHDRIKQYMASQEAQFAHDKLESLSRMVAFKADMKSNTQSAETRAHAISRDYIRQLVDSIEAISPKIFGMVSNTEGMRAFTYELFGQDSKTVASPEVAALAKQAAKSWGDVAEIARVAFNNAGGDIGRLEDWRFPQSHSQPLVARAGQGQWIKDIFDKLNRDRYVNTDGTKMTDPQMVDFLKNAWETIATGGANKIEPGKITGSGMRANYNAEERSIHFKDADSYTAYQKQYGGGDPFSTMMRHLLKLGEDTAMIETFGPNPDLQFRYWLDTAMKEEKLKSPENIGKVDQKAIDLQNLYDYVAGRTKPVANYKVAQGFDTLRNFLVSSRLGSAAITSITDNATMQLTAAVNNMPHMQLLRNQLKTINPADKTELQMARRAGLSLQTFIGEINRYGNEVMLPSFSAKMANLTIRLSALNALTESRRRAFGVTMFGSIGSTVERSADFGSIEAGDKRLLESKGIDQTVFDVWKQAKLEDWGDGNTTMLTPEAIRRIPDSALEKLGNPTALRRDATLKLLGMVNEEVDMAVVEPGAADKAAMKMGLQRGTWKGEIMRSFFLFKSFPFSMISRHFMRGWGMDTAGGKAAYIASLVATSTVFGAMAQQISNVVAGRDPQDMSKGKFWMQSLLKGGSLGIYGDFLFDQNTQYGSSPLSVLSGPVAGLVEDFIHLTQGNLMKSAKGEKTHAAAETVKFLKSNLPLQNLWYTKAITDRLIFNQIQEMASPGYMRRVEDRARKDFGQSYYWHPGDATPERAPSVGAAFGGQ